MRVLMIEDDEALVKVVDKTLKKPIFSLTAQVVVKKASIWRRVMITIWSYLI